MKGTNEMTDWSAVDAAVKNAEQYGTVGVTAVGPDGERWSHNGDRKFRAASTVKIPLMIEIYRKIDRGELSLDDLHTVRDDEKARGSGVMLHLHDGIQMTINDIIYLMISISDNTATNLLIEKAGMDAVNATIEELGMTGSNLGRAMKGRPAVEGEQENWSTPDDYALVTQKILDGEAASAEACEAMTAMLETQQNSRRISRYLPESDDIRFGSKTGSIKGVTNDAGFVLTPKGRAIVSVFCEGFSDQHLGEAAIGDIARAVFEATRVLDFD